MNTIRRRATVALIHFGAAFVLGSALPASAQGLPQVKLSTTQGDIVVELAADKAPKTVANFLAYVKKGHYDGTVFHRVIPGFMIQGGGFDKDMNQKATQAPIDLEIARDLRNDRGTIAMARTANPNSATAQFFINLVDNAMLNAPNPDGHGYAVFGRVIQGMDVVDKIKGVPTGNRGFHQNVPLSAVVITAATQVK